MSGTQTPQGPFPINLVVAANTAESLPFASFPLPLINYDGSVPTFSFDTPGIASAAYLSTSALGNGQYQANIQVAALGPVGTTMLRVSIEGQEDIDFAVSVTEGPLEGVGPFDPTTIQVTPAAPAAS